MGSELLAEVIGLLTLLGVGLALPLDVRDLRDICGTAFQQRVWHALRPIPAGRRKVKPISPDASAAAGSVRAWASIRHSLLPSLRELTPAPSISGLLSHAFPKPPI